MNEQISANRRQCVENARQSWIKKLIDLSRRNNLLYYRPLKNGTLNLSLADKERWAALLHGDSVPAKNFVESSTGEELRLKLLEIWRRAQANLEEKGLATMFVSLGMASWKANDDGRDSDAPVLLLPVALDLKGQAGNSFSLHRTGTVQVNLVLLHVLENEFRVSLAADEAISRVLGDEEGEHFDLSAVYQLFNEACASVPEFRIRDVAILGNFAFQKMAMVNDLRANPDALVASDIIAALAGDSDAKQIVGFKPQNPDPKEFDKLPPQSEFLILDADSSQQSAIAAVLASQSAVIHGPPGTGKSQTIANLVASLAATGRRVLFVAEKRAALQVVLKRLQHVGLEKLAIDLHGADVSPKRVMEQVAAALDTVRQSTSVNCDQMHRRFVERRERLNRHVESLHRKRKPGGMTVYELQGALLRMQSEVRTDTRWRGPELRKIEDADPGRIRDLLREAAGFASLFTRSDPSPWTGVMLANGGEAQNAVDLVIKLSTRVWPDFIASLQGMVKTISFRMPKTLKEAQQISSLLSAIRKTIDSYSPAVFAEDIQGIVRSLAPGKSGGPKAVWHWCTSAEYRQAQKIALSMRIAGRVKDSELFTELTAIDDQRLKWAEWSGRSSSPNVPPSNADFRKKVDSAVADITDLSSVVANRQIESMPLENLSPYINSLAADRLTPMKLPKLVEIEQDLEKSGVGKLVEEFRTKRIVPAKWPTAFDQAWFSSCFEAAQVEDPEIAGFNGRTHDEFVREFKELDRERIRIAAARVRRAFAERAISAMNAHRDQEYVIRSEAEKKRRHRPLRTLFAQARDVLTAVCPCWMASPLSVSQLLDATSCFDFVIFDEASQVLPEDAVPAILRGSNLVVAGDSRQLPPTTFFAAGDDGDLAEEEAMLATEGFESLLDMTNTFMPSWYLDWHYGSRDEALISFSNHHIYGDRLVTFPGPGGSPVVRHVLVNEIPGMDGQEESSSAEVRKVVDLVLEHAESRSQETLGVIAMGRRHADRVQRALDEALVKRPELAPFFDASAEERFFVKNLERVQGDERDAIILTVGYGKDRGGNLPFRFGPLLSSGGQRRLNVAITRARRRMTLVSSFSHLDMDLAKVRKGTGVELLRYYLEYASSGGKRLGDLVTTSIPMNSFEAEVYDVLKSKGMLVIPQVGASRFRIDLVAQHPQQRGRYVLAIECDGATYHSSPTARDRDRLRQQQLMNLGWRFHRIWSTDWFMRKSEEVERAVTAYENAVRFADGASSPETVPKAKDPSISLSAGIAPHRGRGPRPNVPSRDSITDYTKVELMQMIGWIESDGRLRSDDEIIDQLVPELGFRRRGARIEDTLKYLLEQRRNHK